MLMARNSATAAICVYCTKNVYKHPRNPICDSQQNGSSIRKRSRILIRESRKSKEEEQFSLHNFHNLWDNLYLIQEELENEQF